MIKQLKRYGVLLAMGLGLTACPERVDPSWPDDVGDYDPITDDGGAGDLEEDCDSSDDVECIKFDVAPPAWEYDIPMEGAPT